MSDFTIGSKVIVKSTPGIIKFKGNTQFAPGIWYGVELSQPKGKNNGSVDGIVYFTCLPNHGVFVRRSMLESDTPDLTKIIEKLQNKLRIVSVESHTKIAELTKELQESIDKVGTLESQLNMQIVDNEYIRSSNQELTEKLQELQKKYNELSNEFQLLQEEIEINHELENEISFVDIDDFTPDEIKSILERNKQLESALISLKQLSESTEIKLRQEIDELKQWKGDHEEMERITEYLTEENHELSNAIRGLSKTIEELNEIHDLDKQLEENQKQTEIELRKQVTSLTKEIETNKERIKSLESRNIILQRNLEHGEKKDISEYELQLQTTQQTIQQLQIKSKSDSIKLALIESRYNLVFNHKLIHELSNVILKVKLYVSDISVLKKKFPLNVPNQLYAYYILSELQSFYQFVQKLIEYNFETISVNDIALESLDSVISAITNFIQGDDLQEGLIKEFSEVSSIIHSIIQSVPWDKLTFVNNFWLEFIHELLQQQYQFSDSLNPGKHELPEIAPVNMTKEVVFSSDIPDFPKLVEQIDNFVNELYSSDLPQAKFNVSLDYSYGNSISPISIYDYTPQPKIIESEIPHTLISELNSKILVKDQQVSDLKLNIDMLEQNMKSLTTQSSSNLLDLQNKLSKQEQQIQDYKQCIKSLEIEKLELSNQIENLESSRINEVVFTDLKSQLEYNESMKLQEEISHLKQLTRMKLVPIPKSDFSWLKQEANTKWDTVPPLIELSRDLRSISLDVKAVQLSNIWNPKKNLPRYANLLIQERFTRYKSQRNKLLG